MASYREIGGYLYPDSKYTRHGNFVWKDEAPEILGWESPEKGGEEYSEKGNSPRSPETTRLELRVLSAAPVNFDTSKVLNRGRPTQGLSGSVISFN